MAKVAERPVATTNNLSVAEFLTRQIEKSDKSQTVIAQELGYPNPNIITMFKQGRTKLPVPKIPALAKVLNIDALQLMKVVLNEYAPETWAVLESVVTRNVVNDAEMEIIKSIREVTGDLMVRPRNNKDKQDLKNLVSTWIEDDSKTIRHY